MLPCDPPKTSIVWELAAQTAETERVRTGLQTKLRRLDARIGSLREGKEKAETALAETREQFLTAQSELFLSECLVSEQRKQLASVAVGPAAFAAACP